MKYDAMRDGYYCGLDWRGPNGTGDFGSMSLTFLDELASCWDEHRLDWWDGFWEGLATQRRAA